MRPRQWQIERFKELSPGEVLDRFLAERRDKDMRAINFETFAYEFQRAAAAEMMWRMEQAEAAREAEEAAGGEEPVALKCLPGGDMESN